MKGSGRIAFSFLIYAIANATPFNEVVRLYIARQYEWESKTGFHLYLQSTSNGDLPCKVDNLYLIFGIGDGENWRVLSAHPHWEFNIDYLVEASLDNEKAELYLNGEIMGISSGGFLPSQQPITVNFTPNWAKGRAEFLLFIKKLNVKIGDSLEKEFVFPELPLPLYLFEPQSPQSVPCSVKEEERISIKAIFKLLPYPNLRDISPIVDRYGQCVYGEWEEKIASDEDLRKAWEEEKVILNSWTEPKEYDPFGGYRLASWREEATGFYKVIKKNEFWWLITPEGNPCFYIGLCGIPSLNWDMTPLTGREFLFEWLPPKEGIYASCWGRGIRGDPENEYVSFHIANMIRKYGDKWRETSLELTRKRLKLWCFSGTGKWGEMENLPCLAVLSRAEVPNISRHPDIFDPNIQAHFKEVLRKQIEPRKNDPFIVGWSLGNEYNEIINKDEVREILSKGRDVPAKRAFVDYAIENIYRGNLKEMAKQWEVDINEENALYESKANPPPEDLEKLRLFYAERYYKFIYETVKEIDPNHLYLGFWITPGWWENENDWRISAKYCDVIGYDLYSYEFMDERLRKLVEETKKPILCGEFSFPPFYAGIRGFGIWEGGVPGGVKAKDDEEAGELYRNWLRDAASNPYCVGVNWFIYRDQHITGIGGDKIGEGLVYGEHYAFGLVDIGDRPKWELVKRVREANLSAVKLRLEKTK